MARNLDPKCKQCRRVGEKLFLKGERCFTPKCPIVKRNYPPGQHGVKGKSRLSGYGIQLQEKQKVKRMYRLLENQFANYFQKASQKKGNTGELFLRSLEQRLDNVVFRLGLASSRDLARQLVGHGHITVDGERVTIPSYRARLGQVVAVAPTSADANVFAAIKKGSVQQRVPGWLTFEPKKLEGKIAREPSEQELNQGIQVQLIVEYYSR